MSGHSKWAGIKHEKGITDKKRGVLFSKLLKSITAAAKSEPNPDFNPRLRDCIQKAKDSLVPAENIERAVKKAADTSQNVDELLCEAYGPGGVAILIEAVTDNRNRTIPEIKKVLNDFHGKWAESGSVLWAFHKTADLRGQNMGGWVAKFPQDIAGEEKEKLDALIEALEEHEDVQRVATNSH
jgi:YebC/PmpR family DNA-binding regulatory protein